MTSDFQRAANRRNAKQSTGPRSPEGKARSSANAIVHGAYTTRLDVVSMTLLRENPIEVVAFAEDVVGELAPTSVLELAAARSHAIRVINQARANRLSGALIDQIAGLSGATLATQNALIEAAYGRHLLTAINSLDDGTECDYEQMAHLVQAKTGPAIPLIADFDGNFEARAPRTPAEWTKMFRALLRGAYGSVDAAARAAQALIDEHADAAYEEHGYPPEAWRHRV